MRCVDEARQPVPAGSNGELPLQDARWNKPGAPKGNKHAFKHGRYAAEAIESRREVAALIRAMRILARATEDASSGGARPISAKPRD
jgi:hypothetical protein